MLTLFIVLVLLLAASTGFFAWTTYRFYKKAVIYDEIFQYISDDLNTNLRQFTKISTSAILSTEPEVQEAHRAMMTMGKRLNEISLRMEEATGLKLRPPPPPRRPQYTDK
jgi:hypothetical protein